MHDMAEAVAPQVHYEWLMLCETQSLHSGAERDPSREVERKAFLECFLLHARNLYLFFTKRRSELRSFEKTDVVAEDFFDDPADWIPATNLTYLTTNLRRLNRSLAHISYDRVDYERSKRWVVTHTIRVELTEAWNRFMNDLPKQRRRWFCKTLDRR